MKDVINVINQHKSKSVSPLYNQQIAYIPKVEEDQIECAVYSYILNSKRIIIKQSNQACIRLRYLKFSSITPRTMMSYMDKSWSMIDLVNDKIIHPFMLFINGIFIPWDLITVVIGKECYLLLDSTTNKNFKDIFTNLIYTQIISLPDHVSYTEYYPGIDELTLFSFNETGKFDPVNSRYAIIDNSTNSRLIHHQYTTTSGVNAYRIFDERSIKLNKDNVVLFINNELATGNKEYLKIAQDGDSKNELTGHVGPCLEYTYSDKPITPNPSIKFDSTLLTIGDGTNVNGDIYDFCIFVNSRYTDTADNISKAELSVLESLIQDQNSGVTNPNYLVDLQKPFEMSMDRSKSYSENVADAIKTMMSYNSSLFNPVFLEKSNLVIEEYTGEWINSNTAEDGTITFLRDHDEMAEEYILILVNGMIYNYYKSIKYISNKCIIPVQGIKDADVVELLRFKNVNNNVFDVTVDKDGTCALYSSLIANNDMVLFSTETDQDYFDFPADGLQHFPVSYTLEQNEGESVKIIVDNPFYHGKTLKVAYKNRYCHFWFNLNETTDKYTVNLGDKFMYCNEYARYLIFYNGRRLGSDYYRLTLPVRPTTPFNQFDIYLTLPIREGDRLDVIYTPSLSRDVSTILSIPISGDIIIDKSAINYGLSTDLYTIWINGKKVPKSHIEDIDSNHLRVISDEQSTQTVCVTKHIPDIDVLTEAFADNEALWDSIIDRLTDEEIYNLLGISGVDINNIEPSVYEGSVHIRSIMFELIREQYMDNPRVDITGPFIYDYQDVDTTAIEGYDSANNAILPVMDASRTDNLDNVERPWP